MALIEQVSLPQMTIRDRLRAWYGRLIGQSDAPALDPGASRLPRLKVRVGKHTSIGYYRDNNEDRMLVDEGRQLYIVADGMGGQAAGEQASQLAVDLVSEKLLALGTEVTAPDEVRRAVADAVVATNSAILAQGVADPSLQNMGTTIVVAILRGEQLYVAHLGDSRAYLVRDKELDSLTIDHNLAQALYEAKTISREELKTHRFRHVLWKYLGSKDAGEGPDIREVSIRPGDRVLLATDGLTGVVEDGAILERILGSPEPQQCAEDLVQFALDKGSKDNVTCVVLNIEEATS